MGKSDAPIDEVAAVLATIGGTGAFAAERSCAADALAVRVDGVGALRFPITRTTVKKLETAAIPAPFGKGTRTVLDTAVRDGFEIGAERVHIDEETWDPILRREVSMLASRLGFLESDALDAVFDKLLVYGPGQFFLPHQDSERADEMVATLVVVLPSAHRGGAVVVVHRGKKQVLEGKAGSEELALLAFYADCRHEVQPVRSGHRVALTYQLHRRPRRGDEKVGSSVAVEALRQRVAAYFDTPVAVRWSTEKPARPERLTYLLDHEYSEKSLGWKRLKGADQQRVAALREVADRLDCNVFLTLADVHENWQCEDEEWGYGRRHRFARWDTRADEDGEHELIDLNDTEVGLRHWIDREGRREASMSAAPRMSEICVTRASSDFDPFKSEHEGYMGNYGNTVDRWYHRAAVVLWPKARDFSVRAKLSPTWAVKEIRRQVRAGQIEDARRSANTLRPFWGGALRTEPPTNAFVRDLVSLVTTLGEADLADALLEPLGPHRLTDDVRGPFGEAVERFGGSWGMRLFDVWSKQTRYDTPKWLGALPEICGELDLAGKESAALAAWLVDREVAALEQRQRRVAGTSVSYLERVVDEHLADWLSVLDAAVAIAATAARERVAAMPLSAGVELPSSSWRRFLRRSPHGATLRRCDCPDSNTSWKSSSRGSGDSSTRRHESRGTGPFNRPGAASATSAQSSGGSSPTPPARATRGRSPRNAGATSTE